jgi:hypothetical protein
MRLSEVLIIKSKSQFIEGETYFFLSEGAVNIGTVSKCDRCPELMYTNAVKVCNPSERDKLFALVLGEVGECYGYDEELGGCVCCKC